MNGVDERLGCGRAALRERGRGVQPRCELHSDSRLGPPVSTPHVSCGSLFGIGRVHGTTPWKTMAQILAVWVMTLP